MSDAVVIGAIDTGGEVMGETETETGAGATGPTSSGTDTGDRVMSETITGAGAPGSTANGTDTGAGVKGETKTGAGATGSTASGASVMGGIAFVAGITGAIAADAGTKSVMRMVAVNPRCPSGFTVTI